jgi:hypothetical protein
VVLSRLVNETILPLALESVQGRWMASWAYSALNLTSLAIQSLVHPLHTVIGKPLCDIVDDADSDSSNRNSHQMVNSLSYAANDPLLTTLYTQLRAQLVKTNQWRGTLGGVSTKDEWAFVMRCVRLYRRMGCDALALALVQSWKFVPLETTNQFRHQKQVDNATQMPIQRRKTFIDLEREADEEEKEEEEMLKQNRDQQAARDKEGNKMKKKPPPPPPTQFEEPSANSLLDSFGF